MDGMRVRFEIKNLYLRVGNVTRDNESYVLLRAFDDTDNEIVLELTHEQAGFLEDQFYAANRRWEQRISSPVTVPAQPNVYSYQNEYGSNQYPPVNQYSARPVQNASMPNQNPFIL
ncbi:hypothetical protein [Bacillus sp. T33-2]|uniref:hypothetical protein n=1 Tax=Bacillus sp. T33-2 TaxID=2054168 RepID=UPI000C7807B5|nr:hypothetical protein [Bacillus sp. T33-2]PLR95098.1 hypothetical protein CVD19_15705 [Bacillus sp. T33-2]